MNYIILSNGAYSDYAPTYYVSEKEVTQIELDEKGRSVGDECIAMFNSLPERPHDVIRCETQSLSDKAFGVAYKCKHDPMDKYWPETGKEAYSSQLSGIWFKKMETWLKEEEFKELPSDIPEINVSYSDIPHN